MNNSGIFVFTKDRPAVLKLALKSINSEHHRIFVIDDSVAEKNQIENQHSVAEINQWYLGKKQFDKFLSATMTDTPEFSFLLRPLGNENWNLGYARNFALLFSKSLALENVLFMDDDILVPSLGYVKTLFEGLRTYKFTGAHIGGLVDDSVLGHVATSLDIHNERMLSGGFMAFNPNNISDYFLNIYNEDWIWLFLQLKGEEYLQTTEVIQELKNPLENFESKIIFQEFGEIALDGILDLYADSSYDALSDLNFWKRILDERKEYLDKLAAESVSRGLSHYNQIFSYLQLRANNFRPTEFKILFDEYFDNRNTFQKLLKSLRGTYISA